MSDINTSEIKLMQSQRLDETDEGGGQMIASEVVSGAINNLFPDISRFDRVYGRVSLRKAYLAVQTTGRQIYYGSHTMLTEQASDENVSVCFFTTKDWFDTRDEARDRVEAYLVKGPIESLILFGKHYSGTSSLSYYTGTDWPVPEIGDVLVLTNTANEQFVRVTDIDTEEREFPKESDSSKTYTLKIVTVTIGSQLTYDFIGEEADEYVSTSSASTKTYSTVAADASNYYGVTPLSVDASVGELQVTVDSIMANLVPSAASETAIPDSTVGRSVSSMIQTKDNLSITRSLSIFVETGGQIYLGEGILETTFSFTYSGRTFSDDGAGNILEGSIVVGSIEYSTGSITMNTSGSLSGTGLFTYTPACQPSQISETASISVEINNRGFVYAYPCYPIPTRGSLKVQYLANGKWYSLWDDGSGKISGVPGYDVGSGSLNYITGTASFTLKAMPDVGSSIILSWAVETEFYDFSGETLSAEYSFFTQHESITRGTFNFSWDSEAGVDGSGFSIVDNSYGKLMVAEWNGTSSTWVATSDEVGEIKYATGEVSLTIHESQTHPTSDDIFAVNYHHGVKEQYIVTSPVLSDGNIEFTLPDVSIIPNTLKLTWTVKGKDYDVETRSYSYEDSEYTMVDDGGGKFLDEEDPNFNDEGLIYPYIWEEGTVNYTTGAVKFNPDKLRYLAKSYYSWVATQTSSSFGRYFSYRKTLSSVNYIATLLLFSSISGIVTCDYCLADGSDFADYTVSISPKYTIQKNSGLEIVPGGLSITSNGKYCVDGADGKLYTNVDTTTGNKVQVGTINYSSKTFEITSPSISLRSININSCVGRIPISSTGMIIFKAPSSPIKPGSVYISATTGSGDRLETGFDFSGDASTTDSGIVGHVDYESGLCTIAFGEWITNDSVAEAYEWYDGAPKNEDETMVWNSFSVDPSTILMTSVVTSYLPLDADLLGLDPVRLPLDGKVPIFRDGYVVCVHHTETKELPNPIVANVAYAIGDEDRINVELIEAYDTADAAAIGEDYSSDFPEYIPESDNYTIDKDLGTITFLDTFDVSPYTQPICVTSRIETMALASDVQVTGNISITSALTHNFPGVGIDVDNPHPNPAMVSSVLPSGDLQSRAYNEFCQKTWTGTSWIDETTGRSIAQYDFTNYPITVTNKPSVQERWAIQFTNTTTVKVIGENLGVLCENISIIDTGSLPIWETGRSGAYNVDGVACLVVGSIPFGGEYYWKMPLAGFHTGWLSGNVIRFNQDAANYPLWFVRTTLQSPQVEAVDSYSIAIRGDSS